jgi:hypothetical protein
METLDSLEPLMKNPLEIYKYNKVILNNSMSFPISCKYGKISHMNFYLIKIFNKYNKEYFDSFKYFIKICANIKYQFKNYYDYKLFLFINYIVINLDHLDYSYKNILIYLIKEYRFIAIHKIWGEQFMYKLTPIIYYNRLNCKLYKYILSFNIYYKKYNTPPYNIILWENTKNNLLFIKIQNQQEIWRCRRLFILLCIL